MRKKDEVRKFLMIPVLVITSFFLMIPSSRGAEWVLGTKLSYESNVFRSMDNEKGDTIFSAYAAYDRSPSGETRLDWSLRSVISGSLYSSESDFNSVTGTISPGISIHLNPSWRLNVAPYFRGKAVSDSEQSSTAWGTRATLTQKWNSRFYSGEYYNYTDSNAEEDVYSYCENAVGAFAGVNWTQAFFTEIGYEYAHGDSFVSTARSHNSGHGQGHGKGRNHGGGHGRGSHKGFSSAFNKLVIKDTVDRHSYGINVGYSFSKSLLGALEYTYSSESGSVGSVVNHSALVGLEYRF
ncbi:MAG: hypothetical protein A4E72_01718 [Syntrophus sp. PtaU1.Bin208]|nr:MAG: hypothetical protein A4E72_01718 [Syntrophus sp. PtaU1.Bin208]